MAIDPDELPLINDALSKIGASELTALDEETPKARHVNSAWPASRDHCLSVHNWDWAFKTFKLSLDPATPDNGWGYKFAFPGGVIGGPKAVLYDPRHTFDPLRDYALEQGALFADRAEVWARFRVTAHVSLWPALVSNAIVTYAASKLCVPLSHDTEHAKELRKEAIGADEYGGKGGLLGLAIAEDLAQNPIGSPLHRSDPLTEARST